MKRGLRILLGAAIVLAGFVGTAGAAAAAETPAPTACTPDENGYWPDQVCALSVTTAVACPQAAPTLSYGVLSAGASAVRLTWVNPNGPDVVVENLPLSGSVLWPGTVVDPSGVVRDWPGWTQAPNHLWVPGDEFDWTRPSVEVQLQAMAPANAAVTSTTLAYPQTVPACAPTGAVSSSGVTTVSSGGAASPSAAFGVLGARLLAETGAEVMPFAVAASLLVATGAVLLVSRRRLSR